MVAAEWLHIRVVMPNLSTAVTSAVKRCWRLQVHSVATEWPDLPPTSRLCAKPACSSGAGTGGQGAGVAAAGQDTGPDQRRVEQLLWRDHPHALPAAASCQPRADGVIAESSIVQEPAPHSTLPCGSTCHQAHVLIESVKCHVSKNLLSCQPRRSSFIARLLCLLFTSSPSLCTVSPQSTEQRLLQTDRHTVKA